MYWFLYDKSGNIQEAHQTYATDWTNLNGYAGALSVSESDLTAQDAFVNKSHYQVQTVNDVSQLVKTVTDAQLLSEAKIAKAAELQAGLNATLTGGFTSKSTGHTYVTTTNGEANMHGELTRFSLDSSLTSVQFYTADAGWLAHTLTQLQSAFVDGGRWKDAQYTQFNTLYAQSQSATTPADVEAVKWVPGTY